MAQGPIEIVLPYPLEERVRCVRCWGSGDRNVRSRGDFCDTQHLSRHLRKFHPGDTITYVCSICNFRGTGAVPYRKVKDHYEKEHVPRTEVACRGTRGAQRTLTNSGGLSGVRTRASAAAPSASASAGASSRSRTSSRPPTSHSTATTSTITPPATSSAAATYSRPPGTAGESPSYAAVTAAGPATRPPSSSLATTSTSAAILGSAAMTAAILSTARGTSAATMAHPQGNGGFTRQNGAANRRSPSHMASREARKSPRRPSSGGETTSRRIAGAPPTTTSQAGSNNIRNLRRSTSVPLVKSGASRPARAPPRRSPAAESPSFGGLGGARRMTPERTPPTTSSGGPYTRSRTRASSVPAEKCATKTGPLARTSARGVPRGPPTSGRITQGALPAMTSPAGTAVRNLSAALTLQASGGARGLARTPTPQRGTPPPQVTPATPPSICGMCAGVIDLTTPPSLPAASGSATLTTRTVTTTTCGSPVMSTGYFAGRVTPSRPSPLPTIPEVSPREVVNRMRLETTPTTSGQEERRQPGAALPSPPSEDEGDSGGPWRRRVGRRARRRWGGSSSEGDSPAPVGLRRTPGHPPRTPANFNSFSQVTRPCSVVLQRRPQSHHLQHHLQQQHTPDHQEQQESPPHTRPSQQRGQRHVHHLRRWPQHQQVRPS
ncbi:mucin-19-like [Formica exsecta]|uniref:mucin-19-like n=1 Tax=Formica exsecta TaxID=72781 RepID=UPI0011439F3E|nr:mucin-19-like [Formica exsecta]